MYPLEARKLFPVRLIIFPSSPRAVRSQGDCLLQCFRSHQRWSRTGGANTRTSSTLYARLSRCKRTWLREENSATCRHRQPAIPAITYNALIAEENSTRPPPSVTFPNANTCCITNRYTPEHRKRSVNFHWGPIILLYANRSRTEWAK